MMRSKQIKPLVKHLFLLHKKLQVNIEACEDALSHGAFCLIGFNGLRLLV